MKMWRKDLFGDFGQTFIGRLTYGSDWGQSLHKTAALLLHSVCRILTNLLDERDRVDGFPRFEK
jgi:hypothetical protein